MPAINKQSRIPYYFQLAESLRQQIKDAANGGKTLSVPSENELAEKHRISRATVRHALDLLEREGLIYKAKGKGTFVARARAKYELTSLVPTTEDITRRGWKPGTKVLSLRQMVPPPSIADALEIKKGDEVFEIHRLRTADGEPISLQWSYIPIHLCPDLLEHDLSASLTQLLEERYGIRLWTARSILRARLVQPAEAKLLQIAKNSPVIYLEQNTFSPEGQAVEFLKTVWRSDRYDFVVNLSRSPMRA
jgi:GntR family transcriptional regulator, N-acetylglucosamine utilization regulator